MKPKFTADFPEAVVLEGADETLRREEGMLRTYSDTTNVGEGHRSWMRTGMQMCHAVYKGVDGQERETVEMHQAINIKKPGVNQKSEDFVVNLRSPLGNESGEGQG